MKFNSVQISEIERIAIKALSSRPHLLDYSVIKNPPTQDDIRDGDNYVKTVNNFDDAAVSKLAGIEEGAKALPSQSGNGGKFLRTDGETVSWAEPGGEFSGTMDDIDDGATYVKTENNYDDAAVSKLAGIEAGADVTDAANVAAAGAVMEETDPVFGASEAANFAAGDKAKLDGIEAGANNYTHPANHDPSIITQDANNRFVTDAEKAAWNAKLPPYIFIGTLASPVATGANTTPIDVTGLVFNYEANSTYRIELYALVTPGAGTTGCGFQFNLSTTFTRLLFSFYHQLANTGSLSGGHTVADDASVGVSSGMPGTSAAGYPVVGSGVLVSKRERGDGTVKIPK